MGLLGNFNFDDPRTMGLLQAGLGVMAQAGDTSRPYNVGQALSGGLNAYTGSIAAAKKQKQDELEYKQAQEVRQMQMNEMRRKSQMDEAIRGQYKKAYSGGGQELNPNWSFKDTFNQTPSAQPPYINKPEGIDQNALIKGLMEVGAYDEGMALKKQMRGENFRLSKDETLYSPDGKVLASGVSSTPKRDIKEGHIIQDEAGNWKSDPELYALHLQGKRAGATSVSVGRDDLGLKPIDRFSMEGKLSDDYRAETKTDQGVLSAASKIKASLSKPGALADQSAIYSFAKILDPDGAVRESDYAAIMNTAGVGDRIRNYVQKLQTGEALSGTQRKEMMDVMARFENVSKRRISNVRSNYSPRAKSYNLDPDKLFMDAQKDAAPPPIQAPQNAINMLKMNPKLRDAFDAKYGAGASFSVLGK